MPKFRTLLLQLTALAIVMGLVAFAAIKMTHIFYRFPRQIKWTAASQQPTQATTKPASKPSTRLSRPTQLSQKVVVVVVDGLSLEASRKMPFLNQLRKQGADLVAETETPSFSRVGYSVLSTGAKPEVTGVSSNSSYGIQPPDSIFLQAKRMGYKTALIGYDWWLELFETHIDYAAFEASRKKTPQMKRRTPAPHLKKLPSFSRRWLLHDGRYTELKQDWETYIFKHKTFSGFGDLPATKVNEDDLRTDKAIELLAKSQLLYLHIEDVDEKGHKKGTPESPEYLAACKVADRNIQRLAKALQLKQMTLIITSDHGFSKSVKKGGHGGWERTASETPLVMVGKGIKAGSKGRANQRDLASTIAVLLGTPFPSQNQGQVLWPHLQVPDALKQKRQSELYKIQTAFYLAYAKALNFQLPPSKQKATKAKWIHTLSVFQKAAQKHKAIHIAKHLIIGLLVLFLLFRFLFPDGLTMGQFGTGLFAWLLYEAAFFGLYYLNYGLFSFSSFSSGRENVSWITQWSAILIFCFSLSYYLFQRKRQLNLFQALQKLQVWFSVFVLGAALKSVIIYSLVGHGDLHFMPHGLVLFLSLVCHPQTVTCIFWLVLVSVLGYWNGKRPLPFPNSHMRELKEKVL